MISGIAQDIKTNIDLRELIERELGQPETRGPSWVFPCPFHNERSVGGFHVWKDGYRCFSCGEYGDAVDWRTKRHSESFHEALEFLNGGKIENIDPHEQAMREIERAERAARELEEQIEKAQKALEDLRKAQTWLTYHMQLNDNSRQLWRMRGVPDEFQNWWQLGYTESYSLWKKEGEAWTEWWKSPTLSIPIWGSGWQVNNVKHRLLREPPKGGKYIQEKRHIPAAPFVADPDLNKGPLFLVEGEIKSMVTFITLNTPEFQVAGLPGVTPDQSVYQSFLEYEPIYLCMDPDAYEPKEKDKPTPVRSAIKALGKDRVRVIWMPEKIDDAILEGALDQRGLKRLMRTARAV